MTKRQFLETMSEVFKGLNDYYPELDDKRVRRFILKQISVPKEAASQKAYERLRDKVEKEIENFQGPREWTPGIKKRPS